MRQVHLWPRAIAGLGLAWGVATMPTPAHAGYALVGEILRGGPFCHRRRLRSVKNKLNGGKEMRHHHSVALAGVIALAATAGPAVAGPLTLVNYIPVPADAANVQPGGAFSSFDISFADPVTGNIFVADRSNASVDIFSGSSQTFLVGRPGLPGSRQQHRCRVRMAS